jgi:tetratricopeptide (TPR) repeat protein
MKKQALAIALLVGAVAFAQKDEIKNAEKAIKSGNFAEAKTILTQAESLIEATDDKTKDKYYYLVAKAAYGAGDPKGEELDQTVAAFGKLVAFEKANGIVKYTEEINGLKKSLEDKLINNASTAFNNKDFSVAAAGFEKLYSLSPQDTIRLYYAAASALNANDYPTALNHYVKLMELGYTGIQTEYVATEKETGEEKVYGNKNLRDIEVKGGLVINPVDRKSKSNRPQIVSNVALLYTTQDKIDEAIKTISLARELNPDDVELIKTEANLYIKKDDIASFKRLIDEAITRQPDNFELYYNAGLAEKDLKNDASAENYFKKALELKPDYADALSSMADIYINKGNALNDEMNKLGNTKADNIKYDQLKEEKSKLYTTAAGYLEEVIKITPNDVKILEVLKNIYGSLDEVEKFKAIKTKIESLENN